jgi:hypothetical protein
VTLRVGDVLGRRENILGELNQAYPDRSRTVGASLIL